MTTSPQTSKRTPLERGEAAPLQAAYHRLLDAYGPQGWWPAKSRFEIVVGAVLVQHTQWRNAERALAALRGAGALSVSALAALTDERLAALIRPAGSATVKTRRLRAVVRFLENEAGGSLRRLLAGVARRDRAMAVRRRLLAVHGVGPETADAILLYAGGAPVFVADAYARRVLSRHGWLAPDADYATTQSAFETALPRDAQLFNEYHALVVRVGVEHCRSRRPLCEGCPLAPMLPRGGPRLAS